MRADRDTLAALIERALATGPDRELDADIWVEVDFAAWAALAACETPEYTASLDAALALVPEGWHISQICFCPPNSKQRQEGEGAAACLWNGKHGGEYRDVWSHAAPGPDYLKDMCRALTAAALRARMESER